MPLSGSCHRLSTNSRSSSRRSAGYSVPSFKSENPLDRSRRSRRIWKPYFSSYARRATRHSWIGPFFSSAVHSGEASGIRFASYPGLAISAFGPDPNLRRLFGFGHAVASLQGTRSSSGFGSQKRGEGRRLLLAPRLRSQVQGGTYGNANDRQLCREDRERREGHADRQVDERFRRDLRVVTDHLARRVHERTPEPEAHEVRAVVAERDSAPALEVEGQPGGLAVHGDVRRPSEPADTRVRVVAVHPIAREEVGMGRRRRVQRGGSEDP